MTDRRTSILEAATRVIARRGVRGLRVEELAAEAGVSTSLIYYHFSDRSGILRRTLEFVTERAERYTEWRGEDESLDARTGLEQTLLLELQNDPAVRENSAAWGELRASAVFEPDLREDLAHSTEKWVQDIAELLDEVRQGTGSAQPEAPAPDCVDAAERLTALVEGVSQRWLSGSMKLERAQELMRRAIEVELEALAR